MKRPNITLFIIAAMLLPLSQVYAAQGHMDMGGNMGVSVGGHKTAQAKGAVAVGNKICPVGGEKIGGAMGSGVQYEYQGKIYNFCCSGCIQEFKKNPEKYVKIIEKQMAEADERKGHHHMMGEADEHMMTGMEKSKGKHHEMASMMTDTPVKEINLEAYQFDFSPNTIIVHTGDAVMIHATSRDVPHGVYIKEYGINEKVVKGKTTNIKFVANKAGEFDILCSVYCGRGHRDMKAKLIVKE